MCNRQSQATFENYDKIRFLQFEIRLCFNVQQYIKVNSFLGKLNSLLMISSAVYNFSKNALSHRRQIILLNATEFALFVRRKSRCVRLSITVYITIAICRLTVLFFAIHIALPPSKKNQGSFECGEVMPNKTECSASISGYL